MTTHVPNLNYAWCGLIVEELRRLGVDTFFVAPGSRSSPLALSAVNSGEHVVVHFDERGIGFAALGYARAAGKPAVVITTSGSAVANLWPAVCEASTDQVPMILLTADRPPELRDTGANQAMDQVKLFGSYVRWHADLPCPDAAVDPCFVLSTVDHAWSRASLTHPGPVHLNQMLREPLAPVSDGGKAGPWLKRTGVWTGAAAPYTRIEIAHGRVRLDEHTAFFDRIRGARRGVLVAASMDRPAEIRQAARLAKVLGWPVVADIRSGLRLMKGCPGLIARADHIFLSDRACRELAPDVILQIGCRISSKRVQAWITKSSGELLRLDPSPVRHDPDSRAGFHLRARLTDIPVAGIRSRTPAVWRKRWERLDQVAESAWNSAVTSPDRIQEPLIAAAVSRLLPARHGLMLASSMPVRDMDMYGLTRRGAGHVFANRGVSGIDGNLATAVGVAIGLGAPVTLVIGDLAMLHDLNSLALASRSPYPVTLVVINNDGGGIFSFLPIAGYPQNFETCFGVPHGFGFRDAAAQFKLTYHQPSTMTEFENVYRSSLRAGCTTLIEVRTDRTTNLQDHQSIQQHIKDAVDGAFRG